MSSDGRAAVAALAESLSETIKDSARSVAERGTTCRVALDYDRASRVRPKPPNDLQVILGGASMNTWSHHVKEKEESVQPRGIQKCRNGEHHKHRKR
jgi:hypothetical protein